MSESARQEVFAQRIKLAGLELPGDLTASQHEELKRVVAESFVAGYRKLTIISACLALGSAVSSLLFIGRESTKSHQSKE